MSKTYNKGQQEQCDQFIDLFTKNFKRVVLYPVIDKNGVERLGICVVIPQKKTFGPADSGLVLVGLWMLDDDPLTEGLTFKDDSPRVYLKRPPRRRFEWTMRRESLLWVCACSGWFLLILVLLYCWVFTRR